MSSTEAGAGQVVLVVDDEVLVQDLIQTALVDGGFEVVTADNGDQAVKELEADQGQRFVAIVTDINLGRGGTGWEVARRARAIHPTIPVVYITGDSEHEWTVNGVPRSTLLPKPFAPAQLVVAVATLINKATEGLS